MRALLILIALFLTQSFSKGLNELRGLEDQEGNTHLFYRIYTPIPCIYQRGCYDNPIWHFSIIQETDSILLYDYFHPPVNPDIYDYPEWSRISDYEFHNNNPSDYLCCGDYGDWGFLHGFICRYIFYNPYPSCYIFYNPSLGINSIEISNQNDSLMYASQADVGLLISADKGSSWNYIIENQHTLVKISPYDDNVLFTGKDQYLFKTMNGGLSFDVVDSSGLWSKNLYFDPDSIHVYMASDHHLLRSIDFGNSWDIIYEDTSNIHFINDASTEGNIYLSRENEILISDDFGDKLSPLIMLDDSVTGLYKKPASDKLFASTEDRIYEIIGSDTSLIHTITSLKSEPDIDLPYNFELYQNYPNPFNAETHIQFSLPEESFVQIEIYNSAGQRIVTLVNKRLGSGIYEVGWDGSNFSSGIYFYRIKAGSFQNLKKMILIK